MTDTSLLAILLGAVLPVVASFSLGKLFVDRLGIHLTKLETSVFSFLMGAATLSTITFALCLVHEARKGAFIAICIVATAAALAWSKSNVTRIKRAQLTKDQIALGLVVYLYFSAIYLINAIAPEFSPDGATYHLGNVARWWKLFGFDNYTGSIYSDWSQGVETLFLVAFSVGKHSSAAVLHCFFGMLLPVLFTAYGIRVGKTWLMTVAGLMLFVSPVFGRTASSAYNDVALACFLFTIFYLVEMWRSDRRSGFLVACGWLAGFAFSIKYTGIVGLVYVLSLIAWESRNDGRRTIVSRLTILTGFSSLTGLPWLIYNAVILRNPVSPFFNRIFENPFVRPSFEQEYAKSMALYPEIHSRWDLPWLWAVDGGSVGGIFGPWILIVPLALVAIGLPQVRRFLFAAVMFGWPILLNCGTRFLLPGMLFASPALMTALSRIGIRPIAVLVVHAVLSIPQIVPLYSGAHLWKFEDFPLRAALRIEPERSFLERKMGAFPIAAEIERLVPLHAKTFATFQVPLAYTTRRLWHNWQSAEAQLCQELLLYGLHPSGQDGLDTRFSFSQRSVAGIRIRALADSDSHWRVSEIALSQDGTRKLSGSSWKISARPNQWEANLVLDGNLSTFWSAWESQRRGDFLELRFGGLVTVDELAIISGGLDGERHWGIEVMNLDGKWEGVTFQMRVSAYDRGEDPRHAAIRALRKMNFQYLVVNRGDEVGRDLLDNVGAWGLTVIGRAGDNAVLKLPEVSVSP